MSFTESVLERTKHIEKLLSDLGGNGKGLHERATSIESALAGSLLRRLHFIATIRNKAVHEHGFTFDGVPEDFLRQCDSMIEQLSALRAARTSENEVFSKGAYAGAATGSSRFPSGSVYPKRYAASSSPKSVILITAILCATACLALLPFTCTRSVNGSADPFGNYEKATDWSGVIFWGTVWTTAGSLLANGMTKRR